MKITLDWFEIEACAQTALRRRVESIRKGLKPAPGFNKQDEIWDVDIQGACGEMAAAKALNRYWSGPVNNFHEGDVGRLQIRTTRRPASGAYLYVQQTNSPDDIFILVHGVAPEFTVVGWMKGKDAQQKKYLRSFGGRPPVYAVPPQALQPLETITDALHQTVRSRKIKPRPRRRKA